MGYSGEDGFCQEIVDDDLAIAGGWVSNLLTGIVGISTSSIGSINSFGGCHPLACQRNGKCCLLVTFGYHGRWYGCPPRSENIRRKMKKLSKTICWTYDLK